MSITFDFYRNPSKSATATEKETSYHARVVGGQTIELDTLVHHISERCTLSKGDIQAVIGELGEEIAQGLCEGNRIAIPGIGYFYLSLSAPKDATPSETRCQSIQVKRIEYRADQQLKDTVNKRAVFERSRSKNHSKRLTIDEINALLTDYFKVNKYLTRERFATLCEFTTVTACRHLNRLVSEGRLVNTNDSHTPIYEPVEGAYNTL